MDGSDAVMERGVLWGGLLISGSFLLAVMLHQAGKEAPPAAGVETQHRHAPAPDARCPKAEAAAGRRPAVGRPVDCEPSSAPQDSP
jgi:hypothetical protein